MIPRVHFNKTYKNPEELVKLLLSRGLIINDAKRTERYIRSIGYYRLSAYFHPFLKSPKIDINSTLVFANYFISVICKLNGRKVVT